MKTGWIKVLILILCATFFLPEINIGKVKTDFVEIEFAEAIRLSKDWIVITLVILTMGLILAYFRRYFDDIRAPEKFSDKEFGHGWRNEESSRRDEANILFQRHRVQLLWFFFIDLAPIIIVLFVLGKYLTDSVFRI
jgi:hypothetical protein